MRMMELLAWAQPYLPILTEVQYEIIKSCLTRDDIKTAKQHLLDWKIPLEPQHKDT